MINLRGNLLPVFDIKRLLGSEHPETPKWIMVFGQGSYAAGIYADTLPVSVTVDGEAEAPPELPSILQGAVERIYRQGDNVWIEAALEKVFMELRTQF